jgi:hypothetical protein
VEEVRTRVGRYWLEEGIVCTSFLPGAFVTIDDSREGTEAIRRLSGGRPARRMSLLDGLKGATPEARAWGERAPFTELVTAHAMVVSSPVTRVLASFFLAFNRPPIPTKIFADREDAKAWLTTR